MGAKTGIEWTDSTWSPIRVRVKQDAADIARTKGYASLVQIAEKMAGRVGQHCEHASPGCDNCYAETNNHRCLPANGTGLPYDRRSRDLVDPFIDEKALLLPLKWKEVLEGCEGGKVTRAMADRCPDCIRRPRRIFVENQSDLFAEWVTDEMLDRVFGLMALSPQHWYQVLTKRPERMLAYLERACGRIADLVMQMRRERGDRTCVAPLPHITPGAAWWPLDNVWLGVTAEDQERADKRREHLAALARLGWRTYVSYEPAVGPVDWAGWEFLAQIISGGESGRGSRPSDPDWHRRARNFAVAHRISYFFKQWGEWGPCENGEVTPNPEDVGYDFHTFDSDTKPRCAWEVVYRVGKKASGALLDGREWKQFPEVLA